jgi:hypothetical protein
MTILLIKTERFGDPGKACGSAFDCTPSTQFSGIGKFLSADLLNACYAAEHTLQGAAMRVLRFLVLVGIFVTCSLGGPTRSRSHSSAGKSVHVHSYTTKSGKHVRAYDRRPPLHR